jgi:hypothetical protein
MRKIKWLVVYPVGMLAIAMLHGSASWAHTITIMVLVTGFLLLFDWRRGRRRG